MKVLDQEYVTKYLDMEACIDLMENVFRQVEQEACTQYLRTAIELPNHNILGVMPGYFESGYFGAKILSVYPMNGRDGYPSHQGQILLFEKKHGQIKAVVDAMSVTRIRTGAASAAASRLLARPDSTHLALLGSGEQADSHLEAMLKCFPIDIVTVWSPTEKHAEQVATKNSAKYNVKVDACKDAKDAVEDADIICTLTPSKTPVLEGTWVKPGTHINAVGACSLQSRELDSALTKSARFYGDNRESVMKESGDFLIPLQEGRIEETHFLGTIGQILTGKCQGRTSDKEITIFESLGMAVEDLACAEYLYENGEDGRA